MIEFSGCGKENEYLLKKAKKDLVDFLSLVASSKQLRAETIEKLEKKISDFGKCPKAISRVVGSATDGLYFSLLSSKLKKGSKIGVTAYSFHASASCVARAGYIPIFIDIDQNGLMDLDNFKKIAKSLDGIIVVQLFGDTVDEKKFLNIFNKFNIKFIEDAAQRHKYSKNLLNSSLCISSVLSFDPNKIFSGIGSGGAVISKNRYVAEKIASLRYHGNRCEYQGFNSQISESSAWIIKKKIENYNSWQKKRREIAKLYNKTLSEFKEKLRTLVNKNNINDHSLHKYVIVFKSKFDRDYIEKMLLNDGIKTMVHYRYILPELPLFKKFQKISNLPFPVTRHLSEHSLSLPIHPFIKDKEITKITSSLLFHLKKI